MSHYAVIGDPVQHSKSPFIHQQFAQQTGQDLTYEAFRVERNELSQFIRDFFANGGAGLNITLPHKEAVYTLAARHSERALEAGAVNTLYLDSSGLLYGDNTDGFGLIRDIQNNHHIGIADKRVLLLGAGGAVRGVLGPLLKEQPDSVCIANRTVSRAEQLAREFASTGNVRAGDFGMFKTQQFDLIINGTSMGIADQMPAIGEEVLGEGCCCYDMMYKAVDTTFVKWAKQHGAQLAVDGLGMLVEQAAEAFAIWRGVRPETADVIKLLRS